MPPHRFHRFTPALNPEHLGILDVNPDILLLAQRQTLLTQLDNQATEVLHQSVSSMTAKRQQIQVDRFIQWCEEHNIAKSDLTPPSEILLCNYFSTFASKVSAATAKSHRAAIKKWVERSGHRWMGAALLDGIMKGINNRVPPSSKRPIRAPVRVEHLRSLMDVAATNPSPFFLACRDAAASTAFYGLLRLGEILPSKLEDVTHIPRIITGRSSGKIFSSLESPEIPPNS
ncbi:hypothetical protein EV360DRAFT_67810 [Lentinula raphanica]|nr:hypothetical protein EV360DRAFT_67810 [Lentinula raphanica]